MGKWNTVTVEPTTGKSTVFRPWLFQKPHHLMFHLSWFGFFTAFTAWFCLNPIMKATIIPDLKIDEHTAASSDITNVSSTIVFRLFIGVITDRIGPAKAMALVLVCGSLPLAFFSLVHNGTGLIVSRFFMGLLGAAFVPCQYWTTAFFSNKIVGTANAFAGGWGNMGGGATFLIMPHIFNAIMGTGIPRSKAWRHTAIVPLGLCFTAAALAFFFGKDRPEISLPTKAVALDQTIDTDKKDLKIEYAASEKSVKKPTFFARAVLPLLRDITRPPIIILMIQYACTFGVEISVDSVLSTYFLTTFLKPGCVPATPNDLSCSLLNQSTAGNLASIFGMMNLFSRASGGLASDFCMKKWGMKGRIGIQMAIVALNGAFLLAFSWSSTLPVAVVTLVGFSLFCQAGCGSTMGLVPYLAGANGMGVSTGLVGAGGTAGGAIFNTVFKAFVTRKRVGFRVMGGMVLGSAVLSFVTGINGVYLLGKKNLTSAQDNANELAMAEPGASTATDVTLVEERDREMREKKVVD